MAMPAQPTHGSTLPLRPGGWTLDEVLALPEDEGCRFELIDGMLVVSPAPTSQHQRILHRLEVVLDPVVPPELEMLPGVNVLLNGQRMVIPDLAVVTDPGVDTVAYKGDQCRLAVEIHSPSTRAYDRAMKRQLYAQAGVPFLIMIDPAMDAVSATAYELHGDEYRQMARSRRGVLRFERPFPAEVDLTRSRR